MKNKKITILLVLIIIFTIAIVSVITPTIAKYISENNQNEGSNIASFEIDVKIKDSDDDQEIYETVTYDFKPGDSINISVSLDGSKCEVASNVSITIETLNNLPLVIKHNGSELVGSIDTSLTPKASTTINGFNISWPENANDYKYSGEVDIVSIIISVSQKN